MTQETEGPHKRQPITPFQIAKQSYAYILRHFFSYLWWSIPLWMLVTLFMTVMIWLLPFYKPFVAYQTFFVLFLALVIFGNIVFGSLRVAVLRHIVLLEKRKPFFFSYYSESYFLKYVLLIIGFYSILTISSFLYLQLFSYYFWLIIPNIIFTLVFVYARERFIFLPSLCALGISGSLVRKSLFFTKTRAFNKRFNAAIIFNLPFLVFLILLWLYWPSAILNLGTLIFYFASKGLLFSFITAAFVAAIACLSVYMEAVFRAVVYQAIAQEKGA